MTPQSLLAPLVALSLVASCQIVGETGRSQTAWIPESVLVPMSLQAYEDETGKFPLITSGPEHAMLQRLGARIATASGLTANWEFRLVDGPSVPNAFGLPGG